MTYKHYLQKQIKIGALSINSEQYWVCNWDLHQESHSYFLWASLCLKNGQYTETRGTYKSYCDPMCYNKTLSPFPSRVCLNGKTGFGWITLTPDDTWKVQLKYIKNLSAADSYIA